MATDKQRRCVGEGERASSSKRIRKRDCSPALEPERCDRTRAVLRARWNAEIMLILSLSLLSLFPRSGCRKRRLSFLELRPDSRRICPFFRAFRSPSLVDDSRSRWSRRFETRIARSPDHIIARARCVFDVHVYVYAWYMVHNVLELRRVRSRS